MFWPATTQPMLTRAPLRSVPVMAVDSDAAFRTFRTLATCTTAGTTAALAGLGATISPPVIAAIRSGPVNSREVAKRMMTSLRGRRLLSRCSGAVARPGDGPVRLGCGGHRPEMRSVPQMAGYHA
jgi:hypothetical protein